MGEGLIPAARRPLDLKGRGSETRPAEAVPVSAFESLLDAWVFHLAFERRLSPRTVAAYRSDLTTHLGFLEEMGVKAPTDVTPDLLREALARLHDLGRAAPSRQRARSSLRCFYRWLVRERHLETDPSLEVEGPRLRRSVPRTLTEEEVERLFQAVGGPRILDRRDRALLEVAYGTGLRVSELVGLGSEDIDFHERWLRVRGKGNKERMVPLGRPALEALLTWFAQGRSALLKGRTDPGTVFLNTRGGKLSRMGFWRILRRRAVAAGLDAARVHPHLLRHSFATHLLRGGASLRVVQDLLGHQNLTTTEIYTAVDRDFLRRVHQEFHPRG